MQLTEKQAELYAKGELRLSSPRGSSKLRLIKSHPRANDRGVTPLSKRKSYRLWYIKHREERIEYMRKYKKGEIKVAKQKRTKNPTPEHTAALKKAANHRYYVKRKAALVAENRRAAAVSAAWDGRDRRVQPKLTIVPTHKPKKSWLTRLLGGW